MPETNGLEVQARLREVSPDTKVIVMTGREIPPIHAAALEGGAFAFLAKPFDDEAFLSIVRQGLRSRREMKPRPDTTTKNEKAMKHIFTGFRLVGAFAFLALAVGCASTQTQTKENLLIAAGFKAIVPRTAAQQQKLQALPAGKVTLVQKDGKTYYVFPDAANNQAYVGGPTQYQAYRQLRLANKLANENLEAAEMNQDASMNWGTWGGWGGPGWRGLR
jgi:CheY-like chemotaxis protein